MKPVLLNSDATKKQELTQTEYIAREQIFIETLRKIEAKNNYTFKFCSKCNKRGHRGFNLIAGVFDICMCVVKQIRENKLDVNIHPAVEKMNKKPKSIKIEKPVGVKK